MIPKVGAVSISDTLMLAGFTCLAFLIAGFHPFADDAGIYVSGVILDLHPLLYGPSTSFISAYTHLSVFSHAIAEATRLTRLPLRWVLTAVQLLSIGTLLYACYQIARRCFQSEAARWAGVALVAVCLTVPVAGTALVMMDPYVTSRSLSTPFSLLAVCAVLDRSGWRTALWLGLVALVHPLMAIYTAGFLLLLWAGQSHRWRLMAALAASPLLMGAAIQFSQRHVTETAAYRAAALSRRFFFLSGWHWYEIMGLIGPQVLLGAYLWSKRRERWHPGFALALTCIAISCSAAAVALCFAHQDSHSFLIARLQTLRTYVIVYLVLFIGVGAMIEEHVLRGRLWRRILLFGSLTVAMTTVQLSAYPSTAHLEMPWQQAQNPWVQAFRWVRKNTPKTAVFALDADYVRMPYEDTENFRAIARRASLADQAKDGGTASVFPQLARKWMTESTADANLSGITDAQRIDRLAPFNVSWVILRANAVTRFDCPYANPVVKVCRLP